MPASLSDEALTAARADALDGRIVLRGVRVRGDQLNKLVGRLPRVDGDPRAVYVDLSNTIVDGDCEFDLVVFDGLARFEGTTFHGVATFRYARFKAGYFDRSRFEGEADFDHAALGHASFAEACFAAAASFHAVDFEQARYCRANFSSDADFADCRFADSANFEGVQVAGTTSFEHVVFARESLWRGAHLAGRSNFVGASFGGFAQLPGATFGSDASFAFVVFRDYVDLSHVRFGGNVTFRRARFREARGIGPLLVEDRLELRGSTFDEQVRFEASARAIDCTDVMFRAGVDLFARWADITADGADFSGPSLVAALPASRVLGEEPAFLGTEQPALGGGWRRSDQPPSGFEPRVVSLRGAKIARLTLSRVDLRACRFAGSHGLDELRLERVEFASPPTGWQRREHGWGRWTARRTIAEEHRWRLERGHDTGWYEHLVRGPAELDKAAAALDPAEIASLYRSLRRGREQERDEPGAGDFYYGEMEMRRMHARFGEHPATWLSARRPRQAEYAILWIYWLVSGYGLRASRALSALMLTIALLAVPLTLWGFQPVRSYGRSLLFAAESSISLLHAPDATLSASGETIQIILRLAGPLLFGLAVLALRSRVKR